VQGALVMPACEGEAMDEDPVLPPLPMYPPAPTSSIDLTSLVLRSLRSCRALIETTAQRG
jgi:hypothetical protein